MPKVALIGLKFSACFRYLFQKYHILCFDFLSRTIKELLATSLFLILEFFYSALFKKMFHDNVLDISLMS
jgi:hypothetical protein